MKSKKCIGLNKLILVAGLILFNLAVKSQCVSEITTTPTLLQGCEPFSIQFFDDTKQNGASCILQQRVWNFGDTSATTGAENPVHVYHAGVNGDTTYTAYLAVQDQNNDWDTSFVTVTVLKKPIAAFSLNKDTVCAFNESFCTGNTSETGAGYQYLWDFQNGFSSKYDTCYIYDSEGDYTIKLTVTDDQGCVSSAQRTIAVNEIPNPDFSIDPFSGCHPLPTNFVNKTKEGTFPITSWSWDFDGFGTSSQQTPSEITFSSPGIFQIALTAQNSAGCSNTTINNFVVRETPTALFKLDSVICMNERDTITYTGTGSPTATYNWTIEDGKNISGSGQGPLSTEWDKSGTYNVQLIVTENSCSDTLSRAVKVNELPVVTLTSDAVNDSICEAQPITFTATPSTFVTYEFFDNNASVQFSAENAYKTDKLSTPNLVSVIATDSNNCASVASASLSITVLDKPVVVLTNDDLNDTICNGDAVTFIATGNYDSYKFYDGFVEVQDGPGNTHITTNILDGHTFTAVATHIGCEGDPSNPITMGVVEPLDKPTINCGPSTTNSVKFVWLQVDNALNYEISLDDGPFGPYNNALSHDVTGLTPGDTVWAYIRALGSAPCGNSENSDTIMCIAKPCDEISFVPGGQKVYCENDTIAIYVSNVTTKNDDYTILWNSVATTDTLVKFAAENDTTIIVELFDKDQPSCPNFKYDFKLTVNDIPTFNLNLTKDTACISEPITLSSSTLGYDQYTFSQEGIIQQDSSLHLYQTFYPQDGNKVINVIVTNLGCSDTDSVSLHILPQPQVTLNAIDNDICQASTAQFFSNTDLARYTYSVYDKTDADFKEILDSTLYNFSWNATTPDTIFVKVDALSHKGCPSNTAFDTVLVTATPITNIVSSSDTVCFGDSITFTSVANTYDTYLFLENFDTLSFGTSTSTKKPIIKYNKEYSVIASKNGCPGPRSAPIKLKIDEPLEIPKPNCGKTGNGEIEIYWDPIIGATGYTVRETNNAPHDPTSGTLGLTSKVTGLNAGDTIWFEVLAQSNNACGNTPYSDSIFCIMPCQKMDFNTSSHEQICIGDTVDLFISNIVSPSSRYSVLWTNTSTDTIIRVAPNTTTDYGISMIDSSQIHCPPTTKTITVHVDQIPVVTLTGPSDVCANDTDVVFQATPSSYENYQFYDGYVLQQDSINPQFIDFGVENNHFYSVIAIDGKCRDTSNIVTVKVEKPLQKPDIFCGASGLDSIELRWDSVPNALGYEISLNGFPFSTPNGNLKHLVSGLSPNDSVKFTVKALGALPCENGLFKDEIWCYARPCGLVAFNHIDDSIICANDTLELEIQNLTSPSGNPSISWGGPLGTDTKQKFSPTKDTTIQITVMDSTQLQCPEVVKDVNIGVHPIPTFNLKNSTDNDTVCEGELVLFFADTAGFDQYKTFINNVLMQDSNYFVFQTANMSEGVSLVYMTAYDDICFFTSDTVKINIVSYPELVVTTSDADLEICQGDTFTFKANDGFDDYSFYRIASDTTLLYNGPDSIYKTSALNNGETVFVEAQNQDLCNRTTANFNFKVNPIPNPVLVSSDVDNTICDFDTITFTVTPDTLDSYKYYSNGQLMKDSSAASFYITDSLKAGNAIYVIATEDGCSKSSDTIQTQLLFTPTVSSKADTTDLCIGDTVKIWASGGTSTLWSTGETTDTITIVPESGEPIWVNVKNGVCTSKRDTIVFNIDENPPILSLPPSERICIGDSVELFTSGGLTYEWSPKDSLSDHLSNAPFTRNQTSQFFTVTAKNEHCYRTDSVLIEIDLCLKELPKDPPNGITPNGDGTNDIWIITHIDYFTQNKVKIYNRWSNLVYEAAPYDNTWGGENKNGNPLPDGTYFYVIDLGNGHEPYLGYIIIHR